MIQNYTFRFKHYVNVVQLSIFLCLLLRAINRVMPLFWCGTCGHLVLSTMASGLSDEALQDSLSVRLASIRRSRYWMNVTDIGEALHDLRPAVIDLIDLLEEVQQLKPEVVPYAPSRDADVALLEDIAYLLTRLARLMKHQDESLPSK